MTWSPSTGTEPVPTRRSKALIPPELLRSKNSVFGEAGYAKRAVDMEAMEPYKTTLLVVNERVVAVVAVERLVFSAGDKNRRIGLW